MFVAPIRLTASEFRPELWCQKTRVLGLSCGVVSVILRWVILLAMDNHTTTVIYRASIALRGKNVNKRFYFNFILVVNATL